MQYFGRICIHMLSSQPFVETQKSIKCIQEGKHNMPLELPQILLSFGFGFDRKYAETF